MAATLDYVPARHGASTYTPHDVLERNPASPPYWLGLITIALDYLSKVRLNNNFGFYHLYYYFIITNVTYV